MAQSLLMMQSRLTKKISKGRKPAMLMVNQTRTRIDTKNARNNGEQSAANNAIKFYSSVRLSLEIVVSEGDSGRSSKDATDQLYTSNRVRITAIKNKLAPPWIRGQFTIQYGKGVNNLVSVAELAEQKLGIMSGAGFFSYKGDSPETTFSCRGREAFQAMLSENSALFRELERKVLVAMSEEQAKSLGVSGLVRGEAAKELEGASPVLVLEDRPNGGVSDTSGGMPVEEA
jgi:recombination protein RecA